MRLALLTLVLAAAVGAQTPSQNPSQSPAEKLTADKPVTTLRRGDVHRPRRVGQLRPTDR